ncbi:DUF4276 family protein [Variovorax sp. KK3]|uniref:DUF4276 family protein n=1 Tax=Variovorax sp. KK3 TaxID=1855728 RepID=UPI00097C51C6|nr:DUF4276 family protein [Variovorax sp. KK3]
MITVASIVEGQGEAAALPVLLRRVCEWQTPHATLHVPAPIRVYKDRFLNKEDEFRRHLLLAAAKCGDDGLILVLLDADDDCPAARGPEILQRAQAIVPHRHVSVVLANREYEAWFIAAAASLHGHRNFTFDASQGSREAEIPRNAKGWMARRMGGVGYNETTDQPAFTARMNLEMAFENSRSFRKLCKDWLRFNSPHRS